MANTIYVQRIGGNDPDDLFEAPLLEDLDLHTGSEFQSLAEMAPGVSDVINLLNTFTTGVNNTLSSTGYRLSNIMDYAMWKKTPPIEITTTLSFFVKEDAFQNVVLPTYELCGLAVLSKNPGRDSWVVPGVSLDLLKIVNKGTEEEIKNTKIDKQNSKLVSVLIPGVIYLPIAIVKQCDPQYSKHVTQRGYPLWSKVTCTFMGVTPARDTDFINGANYRWNSVTRSVQELGVNDFFTG